MPNFAEPPYPIGLHVGLVSFPLVGQELNNPHFSSPLSRIPSISNLARLPDPSSKIISGNVDQSQMVLSYKRKE